MNKLCDTFPSLLQRWFRFVTFAAVVPVLVVNCVYLLLNSHIYYTYLQNEGNISRFVTVTQLYFNVTYNLYTVELGYNVIKGT
jgi:hypothetical protein